MKRKIYFFTILIAMFNCAWANEDDNYLSSNSYSHNYQEGYKEGATYNGGGIRGIAPIPPIAPIPNIGESNKDAYTRGIIDAQNEKNIQRYQ